MYWETSCSTHVFSNESYEQAGQRDCFKELEIKPKLKFITKFYYKAKYKNIGYEHEICGLLSAKSNGTIKPNPEEIADYKWISISKLKENISKNPRKYAPWLKIALKEYSAVEFNIHNYMKETAREVDKYSLEFLDKLKQENKDLPFEIVEHLPKLRMSHEYIVKTRCVFYRLIYELIKPKGNWKEILPILVAGELYAISTDVLDDIFDNQPVRQNSQTTWKKFGINKAIIAAILQRDICIKLLQKLNIPKNRMAEVLSSFEELDYKLYTGQYLNEQLKSNSTYNDYLKRTNLICIDPLYMVKILSIYLGIDKKSRNKIEILAKKWGTLSMMHNDFLNLVPEDIKTKTKTIAAKEKTFEDIRKGLWTYPVIHFFNKAPHNEKECALKILGDWDASTKDILQFIELLEKNDSLMVFVKYILDFKNEFISYIDENFKNYKISNKDRLIKFIRLHETVTNYYKLMKEYFK